MNSSINPEKYNELKTLFSFYDEEGNGYVNVESLEKIYLCIGINLSENKKEMEILIEKFCIYNNGEYLLSFEKFLEYISARSNLNDIEDEVIEQFEQINKSGTGKITKIEFRQAMRDMGEEFDEEEIQEIFNWVDNDKKDGLTYQDFMKILSNKFI